MLGFPPISPDERPCTKNTPRRFAIVDPDMDPRNERPSPPFSNQQVGQLVALLRPVIDAISARIADHDPDPDRWLTINDLAAKLQVPVSWVQEKVSARLVPHHRVGRHVRFTRADLEALERLYQEKPAARQRRG
ncbi:helix-turn-helix domain-containing protein [Micromonospora rifamycinica]|uniref:helix-turn-helix domain-containing protein n=1 Tax=Micromonospora rifamycinica TaxID=291594 RepID=UPI0034187A2B